MAFQNVEIQLNFKGYANNEAWKYVQMSFPQQNLNSAMFEQFPSAPRTCTQW